MVKLYSMHQNAGTYLLFIYVLLCLYIVRLVVKDNMGEVGRGNDEMEEEENVAQPSLPIELKEKVVENESEEAWGD